MNFNLMELIKHNNIILRIYQLCGQIMVSVLKKLVKPDPKLIIFNCFGGKKFDDSTKAIYSKMLNDSRFDDYKLVWAFHDPSHFPEVPLRIKTDNLSYFIYTLKARCWITNSAIQRGLVFKGKNTFGLNTWHGTPLKYMGDTNNPNKVNTLIDTYDVILAQGEYDISAFSNNWNISSDKFKLFGLPRNDVLADISHEEVVRARNRLGIPVNNKVVLYAPTFRDYILDKNHSCSLEVPFDYKYWERTFGADMTVLFRVHYEVGKHNKLPDNPMWIDCSNYDNLSDLMIASDILITDYSSIMFDYSILERPILNYLYDYDEYSSKRGLLFDIKKELTWFDNSKTLADYIFDMDYDKEIEKTVSFKKKYITEYGNATEKTVDYLYEILSK